MSVRLVFASITALTLLLALAPPARATVGGPETVEVLGYAEKSGKLFLLRHVGGESGESPRAMYFRVDRGPEKQSPDAPVVIRSWYEGPDAAEAEALAVRRIAHLRRHLTPLPPARLEGLELSLSYGELLACPLQQESPDRATIEAALGVARERKRAGHVVVRDSALVSVCRRVTATVRFQGRVAQTTLNTWGGIALVDAWTVPGTTRILVMLRHTGITTETGYPRDVPLLLPAAGAR